MRRPIRHIVVSSASAGTRRSRPSAIGHAYDRHWTSGPFASPAERRTANRRYAAVDG
jgi:hypothetical protein